MRVFLLVLFLTLSGCALTPGNQSCQVTDANELFKDPLKLSGAKFCGELVAVRYPTITHLFPPDGGTDTREELQLVLDAKATARLENLAGEISPVRMYVEGRMEVDEWCFNPDNPKLNRACVPFSRPAELRVTVLKLRE